MLGSLQNRFRARNRRVSVLEFGRAIGRAASLARIAVLVLGAALRTFALDEAVGQKHVLFRIVELLDCAAHDFAVGFQCGVDAVDKLPVLGGVCAVVVVKADMKTVEIGAVLGVHTVDHLFRGDAGLLGRQHDRRAVRVVGADVMAGIAAHFLHPHPDVGLDVFDEVAEVDGAVGVGQGGGNENLAGHGRSVCQISEGAIIAQLAGLSDLPGMLFL